MPSIELSAGTIEYTDTGGDGPVVVFIHGLLMSATTWRHVIPHLEGYRCVAPTWPMGAHRIPMKPGADLSLVGQGRLIGEFLRTMDLRDVVLVQNDWGAAQIALAQGCGDRVSRLVLSSCEAFEVYPPAPARVSVLAGKVPGGIRMMMWLLATPVGRRGPGTWGWMSKRPVPGPIIEDWFAPATRDADIRRDIAKYVTSVPHRTELLEMARRAAELSGPVLVVWASEDKMFPVALGRRLAEGFLDSTFHEIADSYTLLSEDQPDEFARVVRNFLIATDGFGSGSASS